MLVACAWAVLVRGESRDSVGYFMANCISDVAERADNLAVESMLFFRERLLVGTLRRHVGVRVLRRLFWVALGHACEFERGVDVPWSGEGDFCGSVDDL